MRVCNQIKDGIGKTLALFPPKRMALLLLGTAILSFGMHNIHRRVGITEAFLVWYCCWIISSPSPPG